MASTRVTIYHPGLDREISVPAAAVQHYQLAGWQEGGRPTDAQAADTKTAPRRRHERSE